VLGQSAIRNQKPERAAEKWFLAQTPGISAVRFADYLLECPLFPSDESLGYFQASASRTLLASSLVPCIVTFCSEICKTLNPAVF
jgi:hypothetical protein